ncbi:DUF6850 family outer membrane beta-barrel protein [Sphingobacterium humi]|uniref:DUF6850 family outer membrane beta-barrel protein n=1 Tax=Sphingobacterium humi TaxID=1796905 RepID=UPI001BAF41CB|nr:DUF6850 family outer membrane beta-barrel protein [Sphingobacterium humi]
MTASCIRSHINTGIFGLIFLLSARITYAQESKPIAIDLWREMLQHRLEHYLLKREAAERNPVLFQTDSLEQFTLIQAFTKTTRQQVFDPQLGNGKQINGIQSQGFKRLGTQQSIWGRAKYAQENHKNISWNENKDIEWIYPYLTADSVGGHLTSETYSIAGGYNRVIRRQIIGISASYLASTQFRQTDPRPANNSAELSLQLGASRQINAYRTAIGLVYQNYSQLSSITIKNPHQSPSFYQLIGMGMDQKVLWGKNTTSYFSGHSHGINFQMLPKKQEGVYCILDLKRFYIEKSINNIGSIISAFAKSERKEVALAYRKERSNQALTARIKYIEYERKGTSFLFDQQYSGTFIKIGERQDFNHRVQTLNTAITFLHNFIDNSLVASITPIGVYQHNRMDYSIDQRSWDYKSMAYGMEGKFQKLQRRNRLWELQIGYKKQVPETKNKVFNLILENKGLEALQNQQFEYYTAAFSNYNLTLNYHQALAKSMVLLVGLESNLQYFNGKGYNKGIGLSLGIAI